MVSNNLFKLLTCGLIISFPLQATENTSQGGSQLSKETVTKSDDSKDTWKSFTSSKGNFTIKLPTEPQEIEQKIDIPKTDLSILYQTYLSEPEENAVYVVSVWTYPPEIDMSRPEVNLQDGFGGMLSALPGAEVLYMQMKDFQGYKGLEFLVKSEDIFFRGMLFLANNVLYQIFTVYKDGTRQEMEEMEKNYEHFMGSFHLLKVQKASDSSNKKAIKLNV